MLQLTYSSINLLQFFKYAIYACIGAVGVVTSILLVEGTYDILHERVIFWTILSGLQVLISLATFALALRLLYTDPNWGALTAETESSAKIMEMRAGSLTESMMIAQ